MEAGAVWLQYTVCMCEHCVIMMTFIENARKVVCGQIKVIISVCSMLILHALVAKGRK